MTFRFINENYEQAPFVPSLGTVPVSYIYLGETLLYDKYNVTNPLVEKYLTQEQYVAGDSHKTSTLYKDEAKTQPITSVSSSTTQKVKALDEISKIHYKGGYPYIYGIQSDVLFDSNYRIKSGQPEDDSDMVAQVPTWIAWSKPIPLETSEGTTITLTPEGDSFNPSVTYSVSIPVTFLYNLIPNKHYSYVIKNQEETISTGTLDTTGSIRMIRLETCRNFRDIGGWPLEGGTKRIAYGRIFRGSEAGKGIIRATTDFNKWPELSWTGNQNKNLVSNILCNKDNSELIDNLNIGLELDLRESTVSSQTLTGIPIYCTDNYDATSLIKAVRCLSKIIQTVQLGKAVWIHCASGADRTGKLCAIIEALCGASEDSLIKDYECTSFDSSCQFRRILPYNIHQTGLSISSSTGIDSSENFDVFTHYIHQQVSSTLGDSADLGECIIEWFKSGYSSLSDANKFYYYGDDELTLTMVQNAEDVIDIIRNYLVEPIQEVELEVSVEQLVFATQPTAAKTFTVTTNSEFNIE